MSEEDGIVDYIQRLGVCSGEIREGGRELFGLSHSRKTQFD